MLGAITVSNVSPTYSSRSSVGSEIDDAAGAGGALGVGAVIGAVTSVLVDVVSLSAGAELRVLALVMALFAEEVRGARRFCVPFDFEPQRDDGTGIESAGAAVGCTLYATG